MMMRWPISSNFAAASFLVMVSLLILAANAINLPDDAAELIVAEQDLSTFLAEEEYLLPLQDERDLESGQSIGERCGNNSPCQDGLQCIPITVGSRCVPVECLSAEYNGTLGALDMAAYKDLVYEEAGITEQQFVESLRDADNPKSFVDSDVFRAFSRAIQNNTEPLDAMEELHRLCSAPRQTATDIIYFGANIEGGVIVDFNLQFLFTIRDGVLGMFIRTCLGAGPELGFDVSFIFGVAVGTTTTTDLTCFSYWIDVDLALGIGGGAAIGSGFNQIFQYEFTAGFGLGGGGGTSICSGWVIIGAGGT
ncbi:expressed unknown protein [Seminavis robusta]|uniref:Uncharacterized protein n=1 Tax=Seminavis robusta TaxID=568900 RepID=A0A9N8HXC9_9STRA|nr:expressed unknown protein [Seminavis robusta]|eukprot:Sro1788_g297600.1 n/a (308) ;mRNA; f:8342-9265